MKIFCSITFFLMAFSVCTPHVAFGAEMCVSTPSEFQTALYNAEQNEEDDLIKVQQGTYSGYDLYYNLTKGHNITIQGGYTASCAARQVNPANTILDGSNVRRALWVFNTGGGNITVDGFTFQNGQSPTGGDGGGLYLLASHSTLAGNITITNNIVSSNVAENAGGGIWASSKSNPSGTAGTVTISNNIVSNNQASLGNYSQGGGIFAESYSFDGSSGDITIDDNVISDNASIYGGGIYALSYGPVGPGNVTITGNTVIGNSASGGNAGGIYADSHAVTANSGTVTISHNTITGNSTTGGNNLGNGGGIYAETNCATSGNGGYVLISENSIRGNSARVGGGVNVQTTSWSQAGGAARLVGNTITGNVTERYGGGAYLMTHSGSGTAGDIVLVNNLIAGNRTGEFFDGGGVSVRSWSSGSGTAGTITVTSNTVTANRANAGDGFAIRLENNTARFYNNIIRDNTPPLGWDIEFSNTGTPNAYNNNIGIAGGVSWTNSVGNINIDPNFRNPGAWNDNGTPSDLFDDAWTGGNFHLRYDSPCIDVGMNDAPAIKSTDIDKDPRIVDGDDNGSAVTDMGADEYVKRAGNAAALHLLLLSP
jgi:hypothetical protein